MSDATVLFSDRTLIGRTGVRVPAYFWTLEPQTPVVVIVHGYAEHGRRYHAVAHALAKHGYSTVAFDLPGHGHAEGIRGHIESFGQYHDALDTVLRALKPDVQCSVLGHSLGGLMALDHFSMAATGANAVVVTNPYLAPAFQIPAWKRGLATLTRRTLPSLRVPSGLDVNALSCDPEVVAAYKRDPLIFDTATPGWHHEVERAQERVQDHAGVALPVLYLFSVADRIALPEANARLSSVLKAPEKEIVQLEDERHEILNEATRDATVTRIAAWLRNHSGSRHSTSGAAAR